MSGTSGEHEHEHEQGRGPGSDLRPSVARRPLPWRVLHALILGLFTYQCLYASWQVFVVFQPPGTFGPLSATAAEVSTELVLTRRLYAIEGWIAFSGMAIYLALTELRPRFWPPPT